MASPQVPGAAIVQIFLGIGAVELWSHGFKITPEEMFKDGRVPGKFGFDPLGFGKDPSAFKVRPYLSCNGHSILYQVM